MSFARRLLLVFCLTATPAVLLAGFLLGAMGSGPGVGGPGFGGDFGAFYMAGVSAAEGHAALAYDAESYGARALAILGRDDSGRLWLYPPTLFFLLLPFGLLPLGWALYIWTGLNAAVLALWSGARESGRRFGLAGLAFPGSLLALVGGQIGCLAGGLIGTGLLLLGRQPTLAGVLLGLASFKPQLGLLIPVALIAGGHWRAFAAAALSALALVGASVAVFGPEAWLAQLGAMETANAWVAAGRMPLQRMVTVTAMALGLGLPAPLASALQIAVSLAMAALVAVVWAQTGEWRFKISVLIVAGYLAAPYAYYYDLVLLALPLIWWARAGQRGGWRPGETVLLAALWLSPLALLALAEWTMLQFWPLIFTVLLAMTFYRLRGGAAGTAGLRDRDGAG